MSQMPGAASGGHEIDPAVIADLMNYLKELPLHDIFNFVDAGLTMSPEEFVDGMLAEVNLGEMIGIYHTVRFQC